MTDWFKQLLDARRNPVAWLLISGALVCFDVSGSMLALRGLLRPSPGFWELACFAGGFFLSVVSAMFPFVKDRLAMWAKAPHVVPGAPPTDPIRVVLPQMPVRPGVGVVRRPGAAAPGGSYGQPPAAPRPGDTSPEPSPAHPTPSEPARARVTVQRAVVTLFVVLIMTDIGTTVVAFLWYFVANQPLASYIDFSRLTWQSSNVYPTVGGVFGVLVFFWACEQLGTSMKELSAKHRANKKEEAAAAHRPPADSDAEGSLWTPDA